MFNKNYKTRFNIFKGFRKDDGRGSIHEALKVEFEEEVFGKNRPGPSRDEKLSKLWETAHEVRGLDLYMSASK